MTLDDIRDLLMTQQNGDTREACIALLAYVRDDHYTLERLAKLVAELQTDGFIPLN